MMKVEKLPIGIYDDPRNQKQAMFELDLQKSNIIVFGSAMSGKTTFVKNLLIRMHELYTPKIENTYIIDFSGALLRYRDMGFICACFDNSNEENIRRLFNKIESALYSNTKILGGVNFPEYDKDNKPAHITLIIENVVGFLMDKRYESYQETLLKLCREGLSKGISIILTASDTAGGVNRFISGFGQKIAFEMPTDKLSEIFSTKVNPPMNLQGRGLANIENQIYEFQGFMPFKDEEAELESFKDKINVSFSDVSIPKLISFDGELTAQNFADYATGNQSLATINADSDYICPVTVGLDYYDMKPITIDLAKTPSIGIYGKRLSGKTNLLWLLVESAIKLGNDKGLRFVLFEDGRRQLDAITNYLKAKNIDTKVITGAKELKDYLYDEKYYTPEFTVDNYGMPYLPLQSDLLIDETIPEYSDSPTAEATPEYSDSLTAEAAPEYSDSLTDEAAPADNDSPADETIPVKEAKESNAKGHPFTVFIIQNKSTFTNKAGDLMRQCFPEMISESEGKWLFIYSDVKNITEMDMRNPFNDALSIAFLLDNIGEFVGDRGSKTIFGQMDAKELKETYARIEKGDGYFYDIESDELLKLKFIYSDEFQKIESEEVV